MPEKKPSVFVFDVDDTLGRLARLYDLAYLEYFTAIYTFFPAKIPCLHSVYRKFFEIDKENSGIYGIQRGRIAASMIDSYRSICDWLGQDYDLDHEDEVREIGDKPFKLREWQWIEAAKQTLKKLKGQGHKLCALSSYEESLFWDKVRIIGLDSYIEHGNMLPVHFQKTKEDFIKVSGWSLDIEDKYAGWCTVGNGESDIKPALEISNKWVGFYIGHKTTSPYFNNSDSEYDAKPMDDPRVVNLKSIIQIFDHI
jgi:phosphoglycolate phosphatase-like HAD superfamily hydrolase